MASKPTASRTQLIPDPVYGSLLVSKFINCLMKDGRKHAAQRVFYDAMDIIAKKSGDPLEVFNNAVENVKPNVEVRSRRVGGANYQVPTQVNTRRQQTLSIRWILKVVRGKKGRPCENRLADELMAASRREGAAVTEKDNVHRMADANKAFSHFAY